MKTRRFLSVLGSMVLVVPALLSLPATSASAGSAVVIEARACAYLCGHGGWRTSSAGATTSSATWETEQRQPVTSPRQSWASTPGLRRRGGYRNTPVR